MYISLLERCIQEGDAQVGPLLDEMTAFHYTIPKCLTVEAYLQGSSVHGDKRMYTISECPYFMS
jgi:hypothetical protein